MESTDKMFLGTNISTLKKHLYFSTCIVATKLFHGRPFPKTLFGISPHGSNAVSSTFLASFLDNYCVLEKGSDNEYKMINNSSWNKFDMKPTIFKSNFSLLLCPMTRKPWQEHCFDERYYVPEDISLNSKQIQCAVFMWWRLSSSFWDW